ncbi:MAG TPA: hypothetical protein DCX07_02690 [Phycisphaerales bacterium]|nr:hypothetical protein [Phycisphaerales bacterium]
MPNEITNMTPADDLAGTYENAEFEAAGGDHAAKTAHPRHAVSKGNLMLLGLFISGLVAVYLMSLRTGPQEATAEQQTAQKQVDLALAQFLATPASNAQRNLAASVVDNFYSDTRQRQIPRDQLRSNPFEYRAPASRQVAVAATADDAPPPEPKDLAQEQAMEAVRQLTLQSVLVGSHGATAMVSNNLLTEGQTISGWKVEKIRPDEVVLTWKNQKHVLRISQ